ncbi:hypothetical protein RCG67_11200 [Kocuria sp. CPCC 205292]|uniref:hypothetical protein n=1 Tax=Kocuria cellulosilytica TaxID=3071451 RepID=UPI0034D46800
MFASQHPDAAHTSSRRRSSRTRVLVAGTLLALAGSTLAVAPAQAATTRDGCTVTPLAPKSQNNGQSVLLRVTVKCKPDTTLSVESQLWEKDGGGNPDDRQGPVEKRHWVYVKDANPRTLSYVRDVPNTETGAEEVYHSVRFQVRPAGDWLFGQWTNWEESPWTVFPQ